MKLALSLTALACALSTSLCAQSFPEGYRSSLRTLPIGASAALQLDARTVVYFTGKDLVADDGSKKTTLLSFSSSVFGSFTVRIDSRTLLFGENSGGTLWRVPLDTKVAATKLNTLKFNYGATMYDSKWAIVSAKTGGYTAKDNDLVALDVTVGTLDPIATVAGASGPVVADDYGNVYYATSSNSFPAPKGSTDILRFAASQIASAFGSKTLAQTDADVVLKGLDAAGSLALDDDHDLFVTDWVNNQIVEIDDVHIAQPRVRQFVSYTNTAVGAAGLQFAAGNHWGFGTQQFEPFQPTGSGTLLVHESTYGSMDRIRTLETARPRTTLTPVSPVPSGKDFRIDVDGGPAGTTAFLVLGGGHSSREVSVRLRAESPVFWSAALLSPVILTQVSLDGKGSLSVPLRNPGFPVAIDVSAQLFFESKDGSLAGSSTPLGFVLQ